MNVNEIISLADAAMENQLSEDIKLYRINEANARIFCEIYGKDPKDYKPLISLHDEVLISLPYSNMYVLYLNAMIAFSKCEYELYRKLLDEFEKAFCKYAKLYLRNR